MNKILLFIFSVFIGFTVNAQKSSISDVKPIKHKEYKFNDIYGNPGVQKDLKIKSTKGTASGWFHHASAVAFLLTKDLSDFSTSSYYLFKDTSINILYSDGTLEPNWWISAANVTDPTGQIFDYMNEDQNVDEFNEYSSFTFDSLAFDAIYVRNSASNIVDTLVIQVQKNAATFQDITYWSDVITGLPWIYHDLHKWDATPSGSSNANVVDLIKIPLDSSMASRDTLINGDVMYFYRFFQYPMNIPSESWNSGALPKISVNFISGSQYIPNVDTLFGAVNPVLNTFRLLTYKANATQEQSYFGEKSCSYFFSRQFAKTSSASTGYMPFYLYMMDVSGADFSYEYFDFYAHYSTNSVSISQNAKNELSVSQNMPNPFSGNSTINYSLNEKSEVSLEVFDVTGSKVMELNEGVKTAGNHSIHINASSLNAGVYYYSVIAGDNRITKKMIVY